MENIWQEAEQGWNFQLEHRYNTIQEKVYLIRQEVEDTLVTSGNGSVPWSPRLQKVSNLIKYWGMALQQANGQKASAKTLSRLSKSLSVSSQGMEIETIEQELDDAYQAYKRVKCKALKYRKPGR